MIISEYEVDGIQELGVVLSMHSEDFKTQFALNLQGFNLITYIPLGLMKLK